MSALAPDMLRTSSPPRLAAARALLVVVLAIFPALGIGYVFRYLGPHPLQWVALVIHAALGVAAASIAERWAVRRDRPFSGALLAGGAVFAALVVGLITGVLAADEVETVLRNYRYHPERTLRRVGMLVGLFAVCASLPVAVLTYERVRPRDPLVVMLCPLLTCGVGLLTLVPLSIIYGVANLFDSTPDRPPAVPTPPAIVAPPTTTTRAALLRGLGPVALLSPLTLLAFVDTSIAARSVAVFATLAAGVTAAGLVEVAAGRRGRPLVGALVVAAVVTLSMPVASAQGFYAASLVSGGTEYAFAELARLFTGRWLDLVPGALALTLLLWGLPCAIVSYLRAKPSAADPERSFRAIFVLTLGAPILPGLAAILLACWIGDALDRRLAREDDA